MKWLFGLLGGLGVIGCIVTVLIAFSSLILYVVGLVLAFKASILLGFICLIPALNVVALVSGISILFGVNIPEIIQTWINFPI